MKQLLAALQFLTILPIRQAFDSKQTGGSLVWFPAAGLVVGVCAAACYGLCIGLRLPESLAALAGVLALGGFSGFLHLDGVADTADGFFSSRSRERTLEIMRDSRIGTMGAVGVFGVLALKWSALASLPPGMGWRALILGPIVGRAAQVITMTWLPYARPEGGLASVFLSHCTRRTAMLNGLAGVVAAGFLSGGKGLIAICLAAVFALGFNAWCLKKINGITGDTLGAVSEGVETIILCALCAGAGV
ncbi:MAG: adenosylcobinamide-GDP ribazoletransferase [Desulfosalsimonadaceae bacterium]